MAEKPPVWADLLLTLWIFIIGVIYFGGYFWPDSIGPWTEHASVCYAVMLLISVAIFAFRYLARRGRDGANRGGDGA